MEKYLNKEELNIALNSLLTSSKDNDIKQIRSLLKKHVEGFKEQQ